MYVDGYVFLRSSSLEPTRPCVVGCGATLKIDAHCAKGAWGMARSVHLGSIQMLQLSDNTHR